MSPFLSRRVAIGVLALCGALAASGPSAARVDEASLSISVVPVSVHPGGRYEVTIAGRYNRRVIRTTPYLLAFIQYSGGACRRTASAEYRLPSARWSWDFYPPAAEPASRFTRVAHWTAQTRLGTRRVCAYLYAEKISPQTGLLPLATASATFRNVRRKALRARRRPG
jgi:hypothetical protein